MTDSEQFLSRLRGLVADGERTNVHSDYRQVFEREIMQGAPLFLVGKNAEAQTLASRFAAAGFVDDLAGPSDTWRQWQLVRMDSIPTEAWVVNCSTSISPVDVQRALDKKCRGRTIGLSDLIQGANPLVPPPWFVVELRQSLERERERWIDLYSRLADDTSRRVLTDVLSFRLTADLRHMSSYEVALDRQYFEDFMDYRDEVFVDAGGFDGDTSEAFCLRYPTYRSVYLFEPSERNLRAARHRLASLPRIQFYSQGLSDQPGYACFDSGSGSASNISDGGGDRIILTTLDAAVSDPVTFVKMDLEGWELKALSGSRGHIRSDHPKLAIAVYHRASDFLDIPAYVDSLGLNYDVYLRHYTQGWSETVMYFKPA
jgi:FkbM family methyltransferase